jgi:hypothetical protein
LCGKHESPPRDVPRPFFERKGGVILDFNILTDEDIEVMFQQDLKKEAPREAAFSRPIGHVIRARQEDNPAGNKSQTERNQI